MFASTLFRLGAKSWTHAAIPTTLAENGHFHRKRPTCIEAMFHLSYAEVFWRILEIANVFSCEHFECWWLERLLIFLSALNDTQIRKT